MCHSWIDVGGKQFWFGWLRMHSVAGGKHMFSPPSFVVYF